MGLVAKLPLWIEMTDQTGKARRHRPSREACLTDELLAKTPSRDAALERLTGQRKIYSSKVKAPRQV